MKFGLFPSSHKAFILFQWVPTATTSTKEKEIVSILFCISIFLIVQKILEKSWFIYQYLFCFHSEWQDEPTLFLIEFIKTHPSIWDVSDAMYRNVRLNKNLFLDLVNVLSAKYPEHGYTYGKISSFVSGWLSKCISFSLYF